ncbi:hypothetical protein DICPUDRAFT_55028 [Dictyostelium purpureum]|uniref:Profilin n=1 Tax=Dictyostelium purpureum TaxID=5786 RepID=F0ZK02_DICPU|nr:uncharacterized protein DICPUDRAFT_55028 [Dictyostelium purpureum]EGC35746.1 hypothetical protein DICPUDRAFT_55028 [Dictyostelium purpureum]|eukprot:XP_003287749.1 hypothetical protein DICPUDRAFT_55028 [Dictyostelium purpureum]
MQMIDAEIIKKCEYMDNEASLCFLLIKDDNIVYKSKSFLLLDSDILQFKELFTAFNQGQLLSINNAPFSVDEKDNVENNYFTGKDNNGNIIHIKETLGFIFVVIVSPDSSLKRKEILELAHNLIEVK